MQDGYTVFIDESGEAGIAKVRSGSQGGASPYMTLGAVLIPNRLRKNIENTLITVAFDIKKKTLHCAELNHYQILHFIRQLTPCRMRLFGVISRKETLGSYKDAISADSSMYYNKCAQYLLERVGWFMESRRIKPHQLDIIFEKANIDYDIMSNLLHSCQHRPLHENTKKLQNIDISRISTKRKSEEPLLQIADLVAHSLYKCVNKSEKNFNILEPRYIKELSPHFFGQPGSNLVLGAGLYCVHSPRDVQLEPEIEELISSLVARPPASITGFSETNRGAN